MECLQVLDRARPTEVEGVLADADVARVVALPLRDVGELVFDRRARSERVAPSACADLLAEPLLQRFVLRDGDRAAVAELGGGALRAQWTSIADVGIELDDGAKREAVHLSVRALDDAVADVEREGGLGKQATVSRRPRFADDRAAPAEHLIDECAVDVPAVDQQVSDVEPLVRHVDRQGWHGFVLGTIRRRDGTGEDQAAIDVRGNVPLESVEPLALALAALTHLRVLDRDTSIRSHALANARPLARGIGLQILRPDLHERVEMLLERRRRECLGQLSGDPRVQRVELTREGLDRLSLLHGIVPVDVERALDARFHEQGNARVPADLLFCPPEQAGGTADHMIELTVVDLRVQMVLGCLGAAVFSGRVAGVPRTTDRGRPG
jgi:hypothetical protein